MRIRLVAFLVILTFYIIPFQDLGVSFLYFIGIPTGLLKLLLVAKEIIIFLTGAVIFANQKSISRLSLLVLVFPLFALLTIPTSEQTLFEAFLGLRTYLLIFFCVVIGEYLAKNDKFFPVFKFHISLVFSLVFVFSILEYFFLPMTIWKQPFPIMEMKREVAGLITTHNEFYDYGYPVNAFGELTRRMLGPFNEPLYMAYFTALLMNFFFVNLILGAKAGKIIPILGLLMIVLTQTRAIILGIIISIFVFFLKDFRLRLNHVRLLFVLVFAFIPIFIVFSDWFITLFSSIFSRDGRNIGHLDAYITGLALFFEKPFGYGVGAASTIVGFKSKNFATENAFINVGLELGWIGLILLCLFFLFVFFELKKYLIAHETETDSLQYQIVAAAFLLVIQFGFAGLVAPHILTARILIPFVLILGWAYGQTKQLK